MVDLKTLTKIQDGFSNKQKKLFDKIQLLIGEEASIALISLQGVERTSQAEIEVIANLISQFKPIKIINFIDSPRQIILSGQVPTKGHIVKIIPQYKVKNINPKSQPWAIDVVFKLYRDIGDRSVEIATIGVEYDGHPSHYVESKIKSTYKRDIGIVSETGIQSIRIYPELWRKDPDFIKKAINKYFKRQIKTTEKVQVNTIKALNETPRNLVQCPICNGEYSLAGEFCPLCKGQGMIHSEYAKNIDFSEYDDYSCPNCEGTRATCLICLGSGWINRDKALEWNSTENNKT